MKKKQAKKVLVKSGKGDFFVAAEWADEKIIQQEILGAASRVMVYEMQGEDGEVHRGLSVVGVREAVRRLNKDRASGTRIRIAPDPKPIITRDLQQNGRMGVEVMVYAEDLVSGGGTWGTSFEGYVRKSADGKVQDNSFALQIALSKAQRNAMMALIPQGLIESIIAKLAKDAGAVQSIEAGKEKREVAGTVATGDAALAKIAEMRISKLTDVIRLEEALKSLPKSGLSKASQDRLAKAIRAKLKKK